MSILDQPLVRVPSEWIRRESLGSQCSLVAFVGRRFRLQRLRILCRIGSSLSKKLRSALIAISFLHLGLDRHYFGGKRESWKK